MPASVSLSRLSWSAPDRPPLFTTIDLAFGPGRTGLVGPNGSGKSTLLRLIAGEIHPERGAIHLRGAVAMMGQEVPARPGATVADLLRHRAEFDLLDRAAEGRAGVAELARADWTLPARAAAALLRCGLEVDPGTPAAALSGGARSRAALAGLLLAAPDVLLLDEPTNNLDADGRDLVAGLLRDWPATGTVIVASHDRALLAEMDGIVALTPQGPVRHGGGYDRFCAEEARARATAEAELAQAGRRRDAAARRAQQARERKARRDGAGRRDRARGDQPKVLLDAARNRAEASGGAGTRLREARLQAADAALEVARGRVEIRAPLDMTPPPTGLDRGRTVLRIEHLRFGHDPGRPVIRDLSLTVTGPERILISGPNGSGKTTLLDLIAGRLQPQGGLLHRAVPVARLDQHVGLLDPGLSLADAYRRRVPGSGMREAQAALARFGFRAAEAQRRVGELSGGERLRAGLACCLGARPAPMLLMLDEPGNHLDLDGLAALESALAGYDGALLVVSHDRVLNRALGLEREIRPGA